MRTMAGRTQAAAQQQAAEQADAQQQQQAGQTQQADAGVGKHTKTDADGNAVVTDNGGASVGKHAADGAYQTAVKQRDANIAELEAPGAHRRFGRQRIERHRTRKVT